MIESWWNAHALEIYFSGGLVGLASVLWFVESISEAVKERKQKRKDGLL